MAGEARAPQRGRRIAVLLEYDGTAYRGSQYQENGPSIQSELESAIQKLTGALDGRVAFAGRTDAGVHALGQVAAFDTDTRLVESELQSGLNHFLPHDIAVRAVTEVARSFDPRRAAHRRTYRYRIDLRNTRSPLLRERVWHVGRELDIEAVRRAARRLEGTHDFAAFAGPYDGSTERTLERCELTPCGGLASIEMVARSFLPHQVRRTVGSLVEIGAGRTTEEALVEALRNAKAASAGPAAPACGLYLARVEYEGLVFGPSETDGNG
jgi:tRNA pseudouridine38-40 synthase